MMGAHTIKNREDAETALRRMGLLVDRISLIDASEREEIRKAEERRAKGTQMDRDELGLWEKALKEWAKKDRKSWTAKTLELRFGKIGFRLHPAAIKLLMKAASVIERLRARKMETCIRVKEEVDKEALEAYDNEVLEKVGCARKQKEEFFYELKPPTDRG